MALYLWQVHCALPDTPCNHLISNCLLIRIVKLYYKSHECIYKLRDDNCTTVKLNITMENHEKLSCAQTLLEVFQINKIFPEASKFKVFN